MLMTSSNILHAYDFIRLTYLKWKLDSLTGMFMQISETSTTSQRPNTKPKVAVSWLVSHDPEDLENL